MREYLKFYIDGYWVDPLQPNTFEVENPATEQVSGRISLGSAADVDVAVNAARRAFTTWSQTSREQASACSRLSLPNTRSVQAISPKRSPRKWVRRPRCPRARRSNSGLVIW